MIQQEFPLPQLVYCCNLEYLILLLHHLFQLDCVLVKDLNVIESYNLEELKKLILIMFHSFKSYDLVDYLIRILDRKTNEKNIEQFRSILSKVRIQKKY